MAGIRARVISARVRYLAGVVVLCVITGFHAGVLAAPQAVLSQKTATLDLLEFSDYWIDTTGTANPQQVAANPAANWRSGPTQGIYPLLPGQALWLRFEVVHLPDASHWLLEIPYAALDRAELFARNASGNFDAQRAGDLMANSQWTLPQRHAVMEIEGPPGLPAAYLLRLENAQGFSAPVRLITTNKLLRAEQGAALVLGAYFGVALLGFFVGIAGLVWLRDAAYFFYAICALLVGLTQAASSGFGGAYLWPDAPVWADRSLVVLAILALVSFALLSAKIVYLAQRSRLADGLVWVLAVMGLVVCAAMFATPTSWRLPLAMPFVFLMLAVVLAINLWAFRHGDRFGIWVLVSAVPLLGTVALASARYLHWVPMSFYTEQSWLASMAFLKIVMLATLFARSQQRRENRRRIAGVDRIDPATGLINEPVFQTRMARMLARSIQFKHHSAVMIIEVTNTEQIRRDFGRKFADQLPLRVASRLLSTARDIDSAARLTDRQFGMLVEGPFSAEEAATLGPRIVARCLMPYSGLHIDCVAQVRVAYALVPEQPGSAQQLIERLQALLANAPANRQVAVFKLGETPPVARRRAPRRPENF